MDLSDKFAELEMLLLEQRHLLGLHTGVPFILLVYNPEDEQGCWSQQAHLQDKLRFKGIDVIEHRLNTFIFEHYEQKGQLARIFELDRDPASRDDLRQMIASTYGRELIQRIVASAQQADPENSVIFLTGVASIYPFARVSNLLDDLENRVKVPLVVFYPGSERDGKLSFLNQEPHVGYRARRR